MGFLVENATHLSNSSTKLYFNVIKNILKLVTVCLPALISHSPYSSPHSWRTGGTLSALQMHYALSLSLCLEHIPCVYSSHPGSLCTAKPSSSSKPRLKHPCHGRSPDHCCPGPGPPLLPLTPVPPAGLSASQGQEPRPYFSLQHPGHLVFSGQSVSIYWINK